MKIVFISHHEHTMSALSKAFLGEIVQQNPDDEPVSVLLERVRIVNS